MVGWLGRGQKNHAPSDFACVGSQAVMSQTTYIAYQNKACITENKTISHSVSCRGVSFRVNQD